MIHSNSFASTLSLHHIHYSVACICNEMQCSGYYIVQRVCLEGTGLYITCYVMRFSFINEIVMCLLDTSYNCFIIMNIKYNVVPNYITICDQYYIVLCNYFIS